MQDTKGIRRKEKLKKELQKIRSDFIERGTTLQRYCDQKGIDRPNIYKIFKGTWKGKEAEAVKKRLIAASKGKEFLTTVEIQP